MGEYGPQSRLVEQLIERVGALSAEEAEDLYSAHGTRLLMGGTVANSQALAAARRAAALADLELEYERARSDAALTWRRARPHELGPWLLVSQAITNASGALVLSEVLDNTHFHSLTDAWRQAVGALVAVGPGPRNRELARTR